MSKRVFHHPPEDQTGRRYWRSLGQLSHTPEFEGWLQREFPQGAAEFQGGEVSRRNFLQIMGASAALAGLGLSGCRRPEKHIVPFTKGAEWSIPGKALFYSTSMPTRRGSAPLVVATYDGRPTKIEGNPLHPAVKGASDTWAQASILELYDPERSREFVKVGAAGKRLHESAAPASAAEFDAALTALLKDAGDGSGLAFLVEKCSSPTRERLRDEIEKKFPKIGWYAYEPTGGDETAAEAFFGPGLCPVPRIDRADVVMALDCDFLSCSEGRVESIRQFTSRRAVDGPESRMNRLYVVENRFTVTGGMADHRLRVPASQIGAFLVALAGSIVKAGADAGLSAMLGALRFPPVQFDLDWVRESAADLVAAKGKALVLVGERQPAAVQALAFAINSALGSFGTTLVGRRKVERPALHLGQLAAAIGDDKVKTLFILGGNPAYNAPSDLTWADLQAKVPNVIRLSLHEDETTHAATWQVPAAHYLETWGDGRATDGSYVSVQPMIMPLYDGWSEIDLLARIAGRPKPEGPELVQETFRTVAGATGDFVTTWAKFLHDGFLAGSAAKDEPLAINAAAAGQFVSENGAMPASQEGSFEIVLSADAKVDDGRFNNNGWLQEIADPITKLTWDNAAWISPASAQKLGFTTGDTWQTEEDGNMLEITVENRTIRLAALVCPGHADNSITVPLGYGRTVVGRVGKGTGVSAYPLATSSQPYIVSGATVKKIDGVYPLSVTQEHGALEGRGGEIVRESNFEKYKEVSSAAPGSHDAEYYKKLGMDSHIPPNVSLYKNPPLSDAWQWGMTIDLNTCVGCSACTIACQAENNIPIVGKEQVKGNRNMHWLRLDRYFATDGDTDINDPEMVSQPMLCQHCENAPCETVCPVNATVHSEDGINVMAYNRCIGTRYCANNCPFKVRRFNFFDYNQRDVLGHVPGHPFTGLYDWNLTASKGTPDTIKMQKNPNVTVRMRGVMEKCTFCIQRIQEAKIATKAHARDTDHLKIPTDSFTSACAQACPTDAIVFGNIADPDSRVAKLKAKERGYRLLEYLNINTRITYLARVRNPNPKMPGANKLGSYIKTHHHEAAPETAPAGEHL